MKVDEPYRPAVIETQAAVSPRQMQPEREEIF